MSMSDERTGHNPEQGRPGRREDSRSSHLTQDNTDAQQQGPLPGLAGFGQMHQRYAPVTQGSEPEAPAEQPAEPEVPQDIPADAYQGGAYPQEDHAGYPGDPDPDAQLFSDVFAAPDRTSGQPPADYGEQPLADMGAGGQEPPYEHGSLQQYYEAQSAEPHYGSQAPAGHDMYAGGDAPFPYESGAPQGGDPHSALQPFEAHYDDHPEIALGGFDETGGGTSDEAFFQEPGRADAEFLGPDPEAAPEAGPAAAPKERKGRRILMAASGLIGVLALGGALAFAYKTGGDSSIASAGKPPLIQADNSPVKVAPDEPGGKEFPHKNKKIYDRLQGKDDAGGTEKIVPREEEVAASAASSGGQIASSGGQQSSEQAGPETTGATGQADGSPRKVKTLMVRPDGSIVAAEQPAQPAQSTQQSGTTSTAALRDTGADNGAGVAVTMPQSGQDNTNTDGSNAKVVKAPEAPSPAQQEEQQVASAAQTQQAEPQASASRPEPESAPLPQQKPATPQAQASASASASATPGTSGSEYVVQVAARKSQTDALAAFADMQQKYPQLLSGYRPLIQRADLGQKGIWYRLNVGPVEDKKVASTLCQKLKSAGMSSCLVRAQ